MLDPRTHAVRADLADVRLAEQVFAPHYAGPVAHVVEVAAPLRVERTRDSDVIVQLQPGESFELLDRVGGDAWGIAVTEGLVGYCDAAALKPA